MTTKVCPRLGRTDALALFEEIRMAHERDGSRVLIDFIRFGHDRAAPAETGRPISEAELRDMRRSVLEQLYRDGAHMPDSTFDLRLGAILHREMPFVHSDLFHDGTWNFLTLCVFPDLLYRRFPNPGRDRATATTRRRNVLQRVWLREHLLGDLIHRPGISLSEDEFVQLLERGSIARVPGLIGIMVEAMVEVAPTGRPEALSRELLKRVVQQTGVVLLEALSADQLRALVRAEADAAMATISRVPVS